MTEIMRLVWTVSQTPIEEGTKISPIYNLYILHSTRLLETERWMERYIDRQTDETINRQTDKMDGWNNRWIE